MKAGVSIRTIFWPPVAEFPQLNEFSLIEDLHLTEYRIFGHHRSLFWFHIGPNMGLKSDFSENADFSEFVCNPQKPHFWTKSAFGSMFR